MNKGSDPDLGVDFDVPPAIACAHCRSAECEGCAPEQDPKSESGNHTGFTLPWEEPEVGVVRGLIDTARLSALAPELCFGQLSPGPVGPSLRFSIVAEICAVGSYSLIWVLAMLLAFPRLSAHMLQTQSVLLFAGSILVALITFVVFVHALSGLVLEWAIHRAGHTPDCRLGLRFGLYACGWDLLTSPAGFILLLGDGVRPALRAVAQGARVPKRAVRVYLEERRGLDPPARKQVESTTLIVLVLVVFCLGLALFIFLLTLWLPLLFH